MGEFCLAMNDPYFVDTTKELVAVTIWVCTSISSGGCATNRVTRSIFFSIYAKPGAALQTPL